MDPPLLSKLGCDRLFSSVFSLFFLLVFGFPCLGLPALGNLLCPSPVVGLSRTPTVSSIHRLLQLRCFDQIASGLPSVSADLLRDGFAAFSPLLGFFRTPTVTSFHHALLCTGSAYTWSISFPVFRLLFACNNVLASTVRLDPLWSWHVCHGCVCYPNFQVEEKWSRLLFFRWMCILP